MYGTVRQHAITYRSRPTPMQPSCQPCACCKALSPQARACSCPATLLLYGISPRPPAPPHLARLLPGLRQRRLVASHVHNQPALLRHQLQGSRGDAQGKKLLQQGTRRDTARAGRLKVLGACPPPRPPLPLLPDPLHTRVCVRSAGHAVSLPVPSKRVAGSFPRPPNTPPHLTLSPLQDFVCRPTAPPPVTQFANLGFSTQPGLQYPTWASVPTCVLGLCYCHPRNPTATHTRTCVRSTGKPYVSHSSKASGPLILPVVEAAAAFLKRSMPGEQQEGPGAGLREPGGYSTTAHKDGCPHPSRPPARLSRSPHATKPCPYRMRFHGLPSRPRRQMAPRAPGALTLDQPQPTPTPNPQLQYPPRPSPLTSVRLKAASSSRSTE